MRTGNYPRNSSRVAAVISLIIPHRAASRFFSKNFDFSRNALNYLCKNYSWNIIESSKDVLNNPPGIVPRYIKDYSRISPLIPFRNFFYNSYYSYNSIKVSFTNLPRPEFRNPTKTCPKIPSDFFQPFFQRFL